MNKIINAVASEYDIPMKYENKTTTVFIDTQDMEERYGEQLYQEYLEKENKQLKEKVNQLETNINTAIDYINKLEFEEYGVLYDNGTSIMEYEDNCKETLLEILKGGSNE